MAVSGLPSRRGVPEPPRLLGQEGQRIWERVWALDRGWIDRGADLEHVLLLCESMDERVSLRVRVLRDAGWRDRVALRALDGQIADLIAKLGLNPADRAALNVPQEAPRGKLALLRAARVRDPETLDA